MNEEPSISVGLVDGTDSIAIHLQGDFTDASGRRVPAGELRIQCREGKLHCQGSLAASSREFFFTPVDMESGRFTLEATMGIDFHWQQKERQTFCGRIQLVPRPDDQLTVVNQVALETYIASVVCSEMRSESPTELIKAHAVVSRSWLLAQLESKSPRPRKQQSVRIQEEQIIRWYDHQAHAGYDVCADDHCQRYQGVGRIQADAVASAIRDTRGLVLTFGGKACDARFSKCCGGVSEDFRTAWSDEIVPYLVPVFDGPTRSIPSLDDKALRDYLANPPDVYCNCSDEEVLGQVLNPYDLRTRDFFRWRIRLGADQLTELSRDKLGIDLGRLVALQPVQRGPSGRLTRLRLVGEARSLVIGKELEIRRVLSPSHLYSSAFVIDTQGPASRPEAFVLQGAGWGHGVGLCQIGAAAMAFRGIGHRDILQHYYPGTELEQVFG